MFKYILVILALTIKLSFSIEYKHLSKKDAKAFKEAFHSIDLAFKEKRFSVVSLFGPAVLKSYGTIQIQSDKYIKKLRPDYARLDSIVGYCIYRTHIDSTIKQTLLLDSETSNHEFKIKRLDNLLNALNTIDILHRFDSNWLKENKANIKLTLTSEISKYLELKSLRGEDSDAFKLFSTLKFKSDSLNRNFGAIEGRVEEAFYSAIASNDANILMDFKSKYPNFRTEEVDNRLKSVEGDRVRFIISNANTDELLKFLNLSPNSSFIPEVLSRLEPLLYSEILSTKNMEKARIYLGIFKNDTPNGLHVQAVIRTQTTEGYGPTQTQRLNQPTPEQNFTVSSNKPKYKIADEEFKGQDYFKGPEYQLNNKGTIPDDALQKMIELGIIGKSN